MGRVSEPAELQSNHDGDIALDYAAWLTQESFDWFQVIALLAGVTPGSELDKRLRNPSGRYMALAEARSGPRPKDRSNDTRARVSRVSLPVRRAAERYEDVVRLVEQSTTPGARLFQRGIRRMPSGRVDARRAEDGLAGGGSQWRRLHRRE